MAETGRIDDVQPGAEAGGKANQRTGIAGNVRLIEGKGGLLVWHVRFLLHPNGIVRIGSRAGWSSLAMCHAVATGY